MANQDSLGDRMKRYENITRGYLIPRVPVILRVDGRSFHTLCQGLNKPFDLGFMACMQRAAVALAEEIAGAQLAYVQSDEISVLITDYESLTTQPWFDYNIQKMASISAAVATAAFTSAFRSMFPTHLGVGLFDARVFNTPREDVANYFIWRQQDATRNSVQMLGRAHFSHKQLHQVSCNQIQEKLIRERNVNWSQLPTQCKRGATVVREAVQIEVLPKEGPAPEVWRHPWKLDVEPPVFTADRAYVERFVWVDKPAKSS